MTKGLIQHSVCLKNIYLILCALMLLLNQGQPRIPDATRYCCVRSKDKYIRLSRINSANDRINGRTSQWEYLTSTK